MIKMLGIDETPGSVGRIQRTAPLMKDTKHLKQLVIVDAGGLFVSARSKIHKIGVDMKL